MNRWVYTVFLSVLLLVWTGPGLHAGLITQDLQSALQTAPPGEEISVIVTLADQADISQFRKSHRKLRRARILRVLKNKADLTQQELKALLRKKRAKRVKSLWLINGMAVTAGVDVIHEMAQHPQVARIRLDKAIPLSKVVVSGTTVPEWNIDAVRATELWALGYGGQGVVVASMDSGVDVNHPDLRDRWRGGTNSWFDPNGEHDSPHDSDGHGTQTTGIMVGGDAGGTAIGVAPNAKWIAVKIFNDAGLALFSGIHEGFQWLLDPDGNPDTDDAPDIVNNSWGLTENVDQCIEEFRPDMQTLKEAGIAAVFAAGNAGPNPLTTVSPANNHEAFAVGAIAESLDIALFSSRGPSPCDETVYPETVAPGVDIFTSDLSFGGLPGSYISLSGSSFSAPHLSGTMALLLNAFPGVSMVELEESLRNGALDLGQIGPDNDYGYGLIDGVGAYDFLILNGREPCVLPFVDFIADPAAVGDVVTFPSTVSGGTPPYTYAWDVDGDGMLDCDTPDCTQRYTDFYNGDVELMVTDSLGCSTLVTHPMLVGIRISGDIQDSEGDPVPQTMISVMEHPQIQDVSGDPDGDFVLSGAQLDERIHVLVQGPNAEYIDTYSPYFTPSTMDIIQDALILRNLDLEPVGQAFALNQSMGLIIGTVADQTGSGVAGATVSVTDMGGNPIAISVGYMDTDGTWNPALTETSANGGYVIYDFQDVGTDVMIAAKREGWTFAQVEARVYPFVASPEKVTFAPVTGQTTPSGGGATAGSGSSGGCFISSTANRSLLTSGASIFLLVLGGIGLGVLLRERDQNRKKRERYDLSTHSRAFDSS